MEQENKKFHAVMIPVPLQGHINPAVQFAMKLASKGFTITFVNTQSAHHQITKAQAVEHSIEDDIFAEARKSGLDIRYTTISDGFPLSFNRAKNPEQFLEGMLHVFSTHVDDLLQNLVHSNPPVTCLIADTFFVWPSTIAKKYNLVSISLWTEAALVFNIYYHLDLLRSNGHFGSHDNRQDTIDYIPGVKAMEPKDLMSYLQDADIGTSIHRSNFKSIEDAKKTDFIVCNTVQEVETETISALQEKKSVYAIGPIFPSDFTRRIVSINMWSESDCTKWLSTKSPRSVLYVSFGSLANVSKEFIQEIAHGLLLSKVSFLWVIRPGIVDSEETNFLPVGFEDEVKGRGLVVPWCYQIEVFSCPAIGGFLTHCGWNSILESMWCGVPMLCFPLFSDQPTNRKLVVEDWKVGINLCVGKVIEREEVAKRINCFMDGNLADVQRKNIKDIQKILESAISADGSSNKNLNKLIYDLKTKIKQKQEIGRKHQGRENGSILAISES